MTKIAGSLLAVLMLFWATAQAADTPDKAAQNQDPLSALELEVAELEKGLKSLEEQATALRGEIGTRLGPYEGLLTLARANASEMEKRLQESIIGAQQPHRLETLRSLTAAEALDLPLLQGFGRLLLQELRAQSEVTAFQAPVVSPEGHQSQAEVIRIGPFVALHQGHYLEYQADRGLFRVLTRQPAGRFVKAAQDLDQAAPGRQVTAAIDPSRGSILALLVQTPDLWERLDQGGTVGYIILALALLGITVALVRMVQLRLTLFRVERQLLQVDCPSADNPLGRVLLALEAGQGDSDWMEHRLDEAILRELPYLQRGIPLIKLLASIAPLLGLLGTVVGMILTFQVISLYGSGDPRLMAGGISQALVTTIQGLVTAIPLLLLHSVANGMSRRLEQILEEQSAALAAQRIEAQG